MRMALALCALVASAIACRPVAVDGEPQATTAPTSAPTSAELSSPTGPDTRWFRAGKSSAQARQLLAILRDVRVYGLDEAEFAALADDVGRAMEAGEPAERIDELLDASAKTLVVQLHSGRVDPRTVGHELKNRRAPVDLSAVTERLATEADVAAVLAQVEPRYEQYRALKRVLARYRELPPLPPLAPLESKVVEPGDPYPDAANLRNILGALEGARFDVQAGSANVYDEDLSRALRPFQEHHGLQADGRLGSRTFAALTRPMQDRIRQLELTLERYRWLPDIRAPAVIVNVPQFMLYTLPRTPDGGVVRMPVVVGKTAQRTPIFDSTIQSVVFRPYWNVPASITREELLPTIDGDPAYLERNDMEIVRGYGANVNVLGTDAAAIAELRAGRARVRQRPGPQNALGLIKFELPNPYDVYLHSTPQLALFSRERRALSHGCVRVNDASALAIYLLEGTPGDWSPDAIEAATCEAAQTATVRLARPVPVFVLYVSVVVDRDGAVLFFDDVYGHDRELHAMLASRKTRRPP